ncbi:hypothetical protein PFISCL1PPCAC_12717, partial [Pristionchus fissidentatus]
DRAPIHKFTSAHSAALFPRGLGELTNDGLRHASQQGLAFRQHYLEQRLLKERTKPSEVHIRSSPIKRVLMSATSFSLSFLGKPLNTTNLPLIYTTAS